MARHKSKSTRESAPPADAGVTTDDADRAGAARAELEEVDTPPADPAAAAFADVPSDVPPLESAPDTPEPPASDDVLPLESHDDNAPPPDAGVVSALASLEAPAQDTPPAADTPKPKGRYDTPEKKAARNAKEKAKREAKRLARERAVAQATGAAVRAVTGKATSKAAPAAAVAAVASAGPDLSTLLGLTFHGVSLAIPEKWGGGALSQDERKLLGDAWAVPLAPYLSGAAGPWAVAALSTVQVFAVRALMHRPVAAVVESRTHSRTEPAPPVSVDTPSVPVEPAPARVPTQQEPGVGDDAGV